MKFDVYACYTVKKYIETIDDEEPGYDDDAVFSRVPKTLNPEDLEGCEIEFDWIEEKTEKETPRGKA